MGVGEKVDPTLINIIVISQSEIVKDSDQL